MSDTVSEILEFINENDVKFIRLAFCDPFGIQKNVSIMPNGLQSALENGVPFDASAIRGFSDVTNSDLLLFPEPATISVLPWRPQQGRVVRFSCDIKNPDGSPFNGDSRALLKKVIERGRAMGYECSIGAECEFYLFKTDENGEPTEVTIDNGGYLDISPLDKGENIRREICLSLEEMGIYPETSHHQHGPGQNVIELQLADALNCADNIFTAKSVIKAIAARNGLFASFMPKPIPSKSGSGLHLKITLSKNGKNIFKSGTDEHSQDAESFISGILSRIGEMTLFLNPLANSYERFGTFEAPKYISWSHQNRSQLIRIPAPRGNKASMELRSPDPSLNPYLAFALIISAGLEGIEQKLPLPPAINANLYEAGEDIISGLKCLPLDICEALKQAEQSEFVLKTLGEETFNRYMTIKKEEASAFQKSQNKREFFREKYFKIV